MLELAFENKTYFLVLNGDFMESFSGIGVSTQKFHG